MVYSENNLIIIDCDKASLEDKNEFEMTINRLMSNGAKEILVDLSKTSYLPSELMGFMMWKKKELIELKIGFRIASINASLKRLFDNAMLTEFFEINSQTTVI